MRLKLVIPTKLRDSHDLPWVGAAVAVSIILLAAGFLASGALQPAESSLPAPVVVSASYAVPDLPARWPLTLASEAVRRAAEPVFNLHRIRAGRPYKIYFGDDAEMVLLRYQPDAQTAMLVARGETGWLASQVTIPVEVRPRYIHTQIHGNLEGSLGRTRLGRKGAIDVSQISPAFVDWHPLGPRQ